MTASATAPAKLYVILGSHSCRSAMLALDRKGIPYDTVTLPSGPHSSALRLLGFRDGERAPRTVNGRAGIQLAFANWSGTVPALRMGGTRVMTNPKIARHLDAVQPDPPLFPSDPERRRQVEEIETWSDQELQMVARRLVLAAGSRGRLENGGASGPLGPLLFRGNTTRRIASGAFGRVFAVGADGEAALLAQARAALDRVDAWLEEDLLGGEPTVADFSVAPSVGLLAYHVELAPEIERRPAGRLLALLH